MCRRYANVEYEIKERYGSDKLEDIIMEPIIHYINEKMGRVVVADKAYCNTPSIPLRQPNKYKH